MTSLAHLASIGDLRRLARRRLPRFAFDFIDGGAEDEINLARNVSAFQDVALVPRYLIDVSAPDPSATLFGKTYAAPFGMAPIGFLNMAWPGADLMVARLAARRNMPHVISTASSTPLERIAETAQGNAWFQLYVASDTGLVNDLLDRAAAAGCDNLLVTVDIVQPGKRDRDARNRLQFPFRYTPRTLYELVRHPRWSLGTLRAGPPGFANFAHERSRDGKPPSLIDIQKKIAASDVVWDDLRRIRDKWRGNMLLKGVLHPQDAVLAVENGCDGIVVSNHGGRQLDYAPASIDVLAAIRRAVGKGVPLVLDSGIRRGADVVRAKALGADFVLAGRAFAYGLAAAGEDGCGRAFDILQTELSRALGQLGCPRFEDADARLLASSVFEAAGA